MTTQKNRIIAKQNNNDKNQNRLRTNNNQSELISFRNTFIQKMHRNKTDLVEPMSQIVVALVSSPSVQDRVEVVIPHPPMVRSLEPLHHLELGTSDAGSVRTVVRAVNSGIPVEVL